MSKFRSGYSSDITKGGHYTVEKDGKLYTTVNTQKEADDIVHSERGGTPDPSDSSDNQSDGSE